MSPTPKREEAPVAVKDGGIAPITLACISEEERDDAFCIMSGQRYVLVGSCYIPAEGAVDSETALHAREVESSFCTHMY